MTRIFSICRFKQRDCFVEPASVHQSSCFRCPCLCVRLSSPLLQRLAAAMTRIQEFRFVWKGSQCLFRLSRSLVRIRSKQRINPGDGIVDVRNTPRCLNIADCGCDLALISVDFARCIERLLRFIEPTASREFPGRTNSVVQILSSLNLLP